MLRLILVLLCVFPAWGLKLVLKPMVRDFLPNHVVLGDLAYCQGNAKACQKLLQTDLGLAPPPGLDRIYATTMLRAELASVADLQWDGELGQVRLWRASAPADTAKWTAQILADARQRLQGEDSIQLTLKWSSAPSLSVSEQKASWEIPENFASQGRSAVQVQVIDKQGFKRDLIAYISVRKWQKFAQALERIPRATVLRNDQVSWIWKERFGMGASNLQAQDLLKDLESRQDIPAGQILSMNLFRPKRLVLRGDQIRVLSRFGNSLVEMSAKALSDAAAGDRIKCQNEQSGKSFEVLINSQGEGEI